LNNNAKIGAGVSVAGILLLIFHFLHVVHSVGKIEKKDSFKNAPVYLIQTDPAGKKDTMMMQDYLKKRK